MYIKKENRQPISELLERKIGNVWSRLGSCLEEGGGKGGRTREGRGGEGGEGGTLYNTQEAALAILPLTTCPV